LGTSCALFHRDEMSCSGHCNSILAQHQFAALHLIDRAGRNMPYGGRTDVGRLPATGMRFRVPGWATYLTEINMRKMASALGLAGIAAIVSACGSMPGMRGGGEQVTLSGGNEVPAVTTTATGSGTVTVGADCSVKAKITVSGMTATAAHIHQAAAGANGPVIVPFTKSGDNEFVAPDDAKMNEAQCAAYKAGNTYVNVHSAKNPPGEVRAQLKGS
jgi:hypothetical protein